MDFTFVRLCCTAMAVIIALMLMLDCANSQVVLGNCSFFLPPDNIAPSDTVISMSGSACVDCRYFNRAPRWQYSLGDDLGFSAIEPDNEPPECDCMVNGRQLCFTNFDASAVNKYRCLVQEPTSANSVQCVFQVTLPSRPNITSAATTDITETQGEDIVLSFVANLGNPEGTITWSKDTEPALVIDGSRIIQNSDGSLSINNLVPSDRGTYTVTISNSVGPDTAEFRVFVRFIEIDRSLFLDDNGLSVLCSAKGWPSPFTVDWRDVENNEPLPESTGSKIPATYEFAIESSIVFSSRSECATGYRCTFTNGVGAETSSHIDACVFAPPATPTVETVNFTAIRVTWVSMPSNIYVVQYGAVGGEYTIVDVGAVTGTQSSYVITDLNPGQSYDVRVGIKNHTEDPNPTYSSAFSYVCSANFNDVILNVRASIVGDVDKRTIGLAWQTSAEDVNGYGIYREPCGEQSPCPIVNIVSGRATNSYMFPPTICDSIEYTFLIRSVNDCGGGGPSSSPVIIKCVPTTNALTSLTPTGTAITVIWDTSVLVDIISADEVNPDPLTNTRTLRNYTISINSGSVCIQGLKTNTMYQVSLYGGDVKLDSDFADTLSSAASNLGSCLDSSSTTDTIVDTGAPPTPRPGTIENWHIAVIVVGVLAIVAMVFCLVGLCFACQSSKQKVDFGSTSSLQTNSIRDMPMHNHQRSMSPSRSCLSYHTKGHSTNWSDHVDTLRQMETDTGTHV